MMAFNAMGLDSQDPSLLADIYASTRLIWAHRGQFERSEEFLRKSYAIHAEAVPLDPLELSRRLLLDMPKPME